MSDDLDGRVRASLTGLPLPDAPATLRDAIDRLDGAPAPPARRSPALPAGRSAGAALAAAFLLFALIAVAGPLRTAQPPRAVSQPGTSTGGLESHSAPTAVPTTAAGSASAPPASTGPTPLPPGPDIEAGGMVDALHAWAVTNGRLWVTRDAGSTWRDATPPGLIATASAGGLLGVAFADAQHGWVAVNEAFTSPSDPSYGRVDIWRTTDGGQAWVKTQLPKARFAVIGELMPRVQFDALDTTRVFAFQSGNGAKGRNDSDLFWTADGGQTWSADRPTGSGNVGIEGSIAFATAVDGVVVNTWHGAGISVTHDGGQTWADAAWPTSAGGSAGGQLYFGQPVFFGGRTGLLTFPDALGDTPVYRTTDAGSSWSAAGTVPAGATAVSFLDPQRWVAISGTEVFRTTDGGQAWAHSPATGLPGIPGSFLMTDAQHGSALASMDDCGAVKSNCNTRTGLYATVDGGSTWTQLWPR